MTYCQTLIRRLAALATRRTKPSAAQARLVSWQTVPQQPRHHAHPELVHLAQQCQGLAHRTTLSPLPASYGRSFQAAGSSRPCSHHTNSARLLTEPP